MDPKDGSSTKPVWSEEFSVYAGEDAYVQRRQFTKFLVLTSAGMVAGQAWIWLKSVAAAPRTEWPEAVVARASEIAPGTVRFFKYPSETEPCILVRRTNGELVAFSQKCTHLSCAVIPRPAEGSFFCPCHEGRFDLRTGAPTAGPPRRPLTRVMLDIRGRDIYAVGVEERTI